MGIPGIGAWKAQLVPQPVTLTGYPNPCYCLLVLGNSYWTPTGLLALDSYWTPTGLLLDSYWTPTGLLALDSYWAPTELLVLGSTYPFLRNPQFLVIWDHSSRNLPGLQYDWDTKFVW